MRRALLSVAAGALALGGCGLTGDLERPPPLWGGEADSDVEAAEPLPDNTERLGDGGTIFDDDSIEALDPTENEAGSDG